MIRFLLNRLLVIFLIFNIGFSSYTDNNRLVTIGGCVTDIVFALDLGGSVVAVDQSSTYPAKAKELPQTGYIRNISAEGIISVFPGHIITTTDIGPPVVVQQLQSSGIKISIFKSPHSFEDIIDLISGISTLLGVVDRGDALIKELSDIKLAIDRIKSSYSYRPNIAFFMNPSAGSYNAAGSNTRADYLIKFIGGNNVFSDDFNKYRKVSRESILIKNPDIILIGSTVGMNGLDLQSVFHSKREFSILKSVKNNNVFNVDMGKHLGFGTGFAESSLDLIHKINIEQE